jgi:hypothetical protein
MKFATVFTLSALVTCLSYGQTVADPKQNVGGGGSYARIGGAAKKNPYNLLPNMLALTNARVVSIAKDTAGQPYLQLEEAGQTYQIRNFPEGKYQAGHALGPVILVKGISQTRTDGRRSYLWFGTNAVTQAQVTRHESSALALLYPLN